MALVAMSSNEKWCRYHEIAYNKWLLFDDIYNEACHVRGLIAMNIDEAFTYDSLKYCWKKNEIKPDGSRSVYASYTVLTAIGSYNQRIAKLIDCYRKELHDNKINDYTIIIEMTQAFDKYQNQFNMLYNWLRDEITNEEESD